ncbi:unnamed protein product [Protopolystoma xenopodis]|uniref:V-SNARE coiled-coil homology domain-containing protein n=1 Tax=Protopolystoma xenopodis TaxID=117903 RepID=A0A448WLY8_9PLAT|nr:unnamed protein product [Protopolystoma xenopodis]
MTRSTYSKDDEAVAHPVIQPSANVANKRLQQMQAQVDEVVDVMRTNVEKVLERDQKLSQLDDRAGNRISFSITL